MQLDTIETVTVLFINSRCQPPKRYMSIHITLTITGKGCLTSHKHSQNKIIIQYCNIMFINEHDTYQTDDH